MLPLAHWPHAARASLRGVFFDIDDTLTTDGRLTAGAYAGMEMLHHAGLVLVPITGRPAGWCDHIARMWPIDAVVGENGAFYFRYDRSTRRMHRRFVDDEAIRVRHREQLQAIGAEIVSRVRGAAIAADQAYRETDLAVDYCEDVVRLEQSAVAAIVSIMVSHGLTAKVSSIHVNGWFGSYDKLTMTTTLMHEAHGIDLAESRKRYAFIGDSPNDAPMFAFFPHAIGVANITDFEGQLSTLPQYITTARAGAGFREAADAVIAAKGKK